MSTQSEATLEENLIAKLQEKGYEYCKNIKNEKQLKLNFRKQLNKLNKDVLKGIDLTDDEFERICLYLDQGSIFDKYKKLRTEYDGIDRKGNILYLEFLDKRWCKNTFQVVNQISVKGQKNSRYDVTLLINGLPLVQIELKKRGKSLKPAFKQVKYYVKNSYSGLFKYIQIFVISNGVNTKYFSNNNYSNIKEEFTFNWKTKDNVNINKLIEFTDSFLERNNIFKMIYKYMQDITKKNLLILRPYQKYAIETIIQQAIEVKQNGYIWHTTGSGKTLTSFKTSQLLSNYKEIFKVVFVVDRTDLDTQTNDEFRKFGSDFSNSIKTKDLVENLLDSNSRLITTTIQKLNGAVNDEKYKKKLNKIKDKKIVFIYDECHRSQFGKMHTNIVRYFNNSLAYGFTGTPIFDENRNNDLTTNYIFGGEALHKYLIQDAIADKNVLKFHVRYEEAGSIKENIVDDTVNAINKEEIWSDRERLNNIVDNIIENFDKLTVNRRFNSIFAVSPKGYIHEYYKLFKEKNHDLKIAAILSPKNNEDELEDGGKRTNELLEMYIRDYNKMFGTNFSSNNFKEYNMDVSDKMKKGEIDLLLVVNMYLTGFDSPLLNTLFVDKNMEYHTLLQAFSRTNRIFDKFKTQGNIVCYRGLKKNVDNAIKLFSNGNASGDVFIEEYDYYKDEFNKILKDLYNIVNNPDDALKIKSESEKENFLSTFIKLVKTKKMLDYFPEFSFDHLNIDEQTFNDFKSAYLGIYRRDSNPQNNKTSIKNDIDYEIELIQEDIIDFDYIMQLLSNLDINSKTYDYDRNNLIKILKQNEPSQSKIDLIMNFIDNELGNIKYKNESITESFDNFMEKERKNSILNLINEENLKSEIIKEVIDNYEFSEKLDDELIEDSFIDENLGFLEIFDKTENIKNKIIKLTDTFDY